MTTLTCAIQLGTSRIMAVAAHKDMRLGTLGNIQIESESANGCISHGCIVNVEQAAMHIRSLLQKLSNRMRTSIASAYVGAGGISLHSLVQQPSVQVPDYDVLESLPLQNGQYQLIMGEKRIRMRVQAAMERAGIHMLGFIALPKATANILSSEERQNGCMLVDMGAATTTVSVYKGGDLRHLAVIPLGSDCVTYDIQAEGISRSEAERLKCEWSNVSPAANADASGIGAVNALFADKALPIPQNQLNTIAICRYEEIIANVLHQLEASGLRPADLESGCVITGGAAVQNGITALFSRRLGIARIEVRACAERAMLGSERKPQLTNLLSLLSFCTEGCQAPMRPIATPQASSRPQQTVSSRTKATSSVPDGQLPLELPDAEPEQEPEKIIDKPIHTDHFDQESHPIRNGLLRFAKDLFTGQK